ncbi:AhpC/TSA family protein [Modicisalibacter xianhensis]|uniref:AhpC/TSA family protein n=1 Tax=Modicisalibacter xianhensis TaxID=442341 RepID=A0A4R8F9F9_9GAMM|nr:redoxin domain-containing protein [Halomonas xianhensis]TDX22139.1 AhpC/TSA family protein [Halomonas xianhensis]
MQHTQPLSTDTANKRHNYTHFHPQTLGRDAKLVMQIVGPLPGEKAPDFTLPDTEGHNWRLSELQGKPVVLIFGSGTCPMTTGSLPGLNQLYQEMGDDAQWLMVYVREAHPGEDMPAHETHEQKRNQAQRMRNEENIAWPVLIGELDGHTHQAYTELPNHIFLIDREGYVAFRGEFAHAPTLYTALSQLEAQDGLGPVSPSLDRSMHMLGATAYGWRGPRRGGKVSMEDLVRGAPPLAANLKMGEMMQPLLAPLASRSRPLPTSTKVAMAVGALGVAALAWRKFQQR